MGFFRIFLPFCHRKHFFALLPSQFILDFFRNILNTTSWFCVIVVINTHRVVTNSQSFELERQELFLLKQSNQTLQLYLLQCHDYNIKVQK